MEVENPPSLALPAVQSTTAMEPARVEAEDDSGAECPECGYDLRGVPPDSARCPECGLEIDPVAARKPHLPWVHRRQIGRVRAFIRTALLVTLQPRRFVEDVRRPAERRDGVLFRAIVVALVLLPLAFMTWVETPFDPRMIESVVQDIASGVPSAQGWLVPTLYGVEWAAVRVACVAGGLVALTGAGLPFLRGGDMTATRRGRARALAHYTCAPLLVVPTYFLVGVAVAVLANRAFMVVMGYLLAGAILLVLAVLDWWWVQVLLVHRATGSVRRAVRAGALLPVLWVMLAFVFLIVLPWLVGWARIVAASLAD